MASHDLADDDTYRLQSVTSNMDSPSPQVHVQSHNSSRSQASDGRRPFRYHSAPEDDHDGYEDGHLEGMNQGLGISSTSTPDARASVGPVPLAFNPQSSQPRPASRFLTSAPSSTHLGPGPSPLGLSYSSGKNKTLECTVTEIDGQSVRSTQDSTDVASSDSDRLHVQRPVSTGMPGFHCPTEKHILQSGWGWLSVSIMALAVYSTVFSAVFLAIAIARPRHGHRIGTNGHLSSSTAQLLSALFSKTVELSFVTVFVAFLGQVISRKAFQNRSRKAGMSIADMSMRTWIMQPGTLITHYKMVRYGAETLLGAIALTTAVMAMFYTTAAEALVSPNLKYGPLENKALAGLVEATFANPIYLAQNCPTPIQASVDPDNKGTTCVQIEHAGQAFHNFQSYLGGWAVEVADRNTSSKEYAGRPPPVANLFDNTTVTGQWIRPSFENVTSDSLLHKRFIQNVTMVMPHANLLNAVRDPINGILQPDELQGGNGQYRVQASVPAPAVNILCAGMTAEELAPLIYITWPDSNGTFNSSEWMSLPPANLPQLPAYPNATVVDHLFGFGPELGQGRQRAPIFPKYPLPYNTLTNSTGVWPADAIYIIAAPPPNIRTAEYQFCSIKAMLYPNCTTNYHAATSGGSMSVHCDDDLRNTNPYVKSEPLARSGNWDSDWKNIGAEWANSISLAAGMDDANAAIARILTQMIPAYDDRTFATALDPNLPSIGEALGVLAGCTLLLSTQNSPFIHYWNYSEKIASLEPPQYQLFNASVTYQDYASGGTQRWQGIFYVVLLAVFVMNILCLGYLAWTFRGEGQVTDYTEPQNLFALAINSPPSSTLAGSCGAGPDGEVLAKKWQIDMHPPSESARGAHPHFYVKCPDDDDYDRGSLLGFSEVRKRQIKMKLTGIDDFESDESPAVQQYMKLTSRRTTTL